MRSARLLVNLADNFFFTDIENVSILVQSGNLSYLQILEEINIGVCQIYE